MNKLQKFIVTKVLGIETFIEFKTQISPIGSIVKNNVLICGDLEVTGYVKCGTTKPININKTKKSEC